MMTPTPDTAVRHKVMLAMPGPSMSFPTCKGLIEASNRHEVGLDNSGGSWDNFNTLFAVALNRAARGEITHFAMLHADIAPMPGWLDVLLEECDRLDADLVSALVPLKDGRGITSSGLGRIGDPWGGAFRRVAVRELAGLPETFDNADLGYPQHPLLHNNGCLGLRPPQSGFYQRRAGPGGRPIRRLPLGHVRFPAADRQIPGRILRAGRERRLVFFPPALGAGRENLPHPARQAVAPRRRHGLPELRRLGQRVGRRTDPLALGA